MWTAISLFGGKLWSNPVTQKIVYVLVALVAAAFGIYLVREQAKGEQRATDKAREVKATEKTLSKIEEKSDAIIAKAAAIRAADPVIGNGDRMSDPGSVAPWNYRD